MLIWTMITCHCYHHVVNVLTTEFMQSQQERPATGTEGMRRTNERANGSDEMVSSSGLRLNGASRSGGMLLAEIAIGLKVMGAVPAADQW